MYSNVTRKKIVEQIFFQKKYFILFICQNLHQFYSVFLFDVDVLEFLSAYLSAYFVHIFVHILATLGAYFTLFKCITIRSLLITLTLCGANSFHK